MAKSRTQKLITLWKWSTIGLTLLVLGIVFFKPQKPQPQTQKQKPAIIQKKQKVPQLVGMDQPDSKAAMTPEALVAAGKKIIFLTDNPTLNAMGRMPVGKGQCAFCHIFVEGQQSDRGPDLRNIEIRSHERIKEVRYAQATEKYAETPEPQSKLKPKATRGGEYLIESLYCPSCYVVEGFGTASSQRQVSKMPFVSEMPMMLNDYEMVAVVAYLQNMDTPGDYSKVTAKADWERYFNKKLTIGKDRRPSFPSHVNLLKTALLTDTPEEMIKKTGCFVCHKIPTISIATTGLIGPELRMKNKALKRINSEEYLKAVRVNRARAETPKEYVLESILDPAAFVVPGYGDGDGMPKNYGTKLTVGALDKLVDFLLTLDESSGRNTSEGDSVKADDISKRD